ncbi:hypothetical protein Asi03nite_41220 [Actinoplanes siamensis]|uniref:Secreted protein n=1 Tax=Actinoplanes siamensis TaxID=1223317 RepID=A0A919N992_9ACTN|nr:hypothetical protein Asi03nite_41220 [Actinoplanes siamensis]
MRLTAYALGLIVVFGGAAGAGRLFGPDPATPTPAHPEAATTHSGVERAHSDTARENSAGTAGNPGTGAHGGHDASKALPGGLQVTQDGYTLIPLTTELPAGRRETFAFRIIGPDAEPVTGFTGELHLIVVRRDMAGYQHLHPALAPDGTWSAPLTVRDPGPYRVFADFTPQARAQGLVLGADVTAPGDYRPRGLPGPAWEASPDGYTVTRAGDPRAGGTSWMTISVSRNGQPVTLEPYLGSFAHLVALRPGDLAYRHLHPRDGATAGSDVTVDAAVPSTGAYRLFLEFKHGGTVHLAEFTATTGTGHTHD